MPARPPAAGLLAMVVLGLGLVVAACSGGDSAGASPVPTNRVDMPRSYRFEPVAITVTAGATVTWTNSDQFSHSVRFGDAGDPDLVLRPGETGTLAFEEPGSFRYVCTFHPTDMTGTVLVTAN